MVELAVGFASQRRDVATERVQKQAARRSAGAAVAVQHHSETGGASALDVNDGQHLLHMRLFDAMNAGSPADEVPGRSTDRFGVVPSFDSLTGFRRQYGPIRSEHLEPVPGGGVVAGGDLDSARIAASSNRETGGRRWQNSGVDRRAARASQSRGDGVGEEFAARPPVA